MFSADDSTSATLLRRVAAWDDHAAWSRFRAAYDPLLRQWCRGFGLDGDSCDEVSQRVWVELAVRMRTFEYDPGGSFRGWLRRLCGSRALNYLKQRRADALPRFDDWDDVAAGPDADDRLDHPLLAAAERIQAAVRARVDPKTWEAFWLTAVRDWSAGRAAEALGMSVPAVYVARGRVARRLRDEGGRA